MAGLESQNQLDPLRFRVLAALAVAAPSERYTRAIPAAANVSPRYGEDVIRWAVAMGLVEAEGKIPGTNRTRLGLTPRAGLFIRPQAQAIQAVRRRLDRPEFAVAAVTDDAGVTADRLTGSQLEFYSLVAEGARSVGALAAAAGLSPKTAFEFVKKEIAAGRLATITGRVTDDFVPMPAFYEVGRAIRDRYGDLIDRAGLGQVPAKPLERSFDVRQVAHMRLLSDLFAMTAGPRTISRLAHVYGVQRAPMVNLIEPWIARGLVTVNTDTGDEAAELRITPEALDAAERFFGRQLELARQLQMEARRQDLVGTPEQEPLPANLTMETVEILGAIGSSGGEASDVAVMRHTGSDAYAIRRVMSALVGRAWARDGADTEARSIVITDVGRAGLAAIGAALERLANHGAAGVARERELREVSVVPRLEEHISFSQMRGLIGYAGRDTAATVPEVAAEVSLKTQALRVQVLPLLVARGEVEMEPLQFSATGAPIPPRNRRARILTEGLERAAVLADVAAAWAEAIGDQRARRNLTRSSAGEFTTDGTTREVQGLVNLAVHDGKTLRELARATGSRQVRTFIEKYERMGWIEPGSTSLDRTVVVTEHGWHALGGLQHELESLSGLVRGRPDFPHWLNRGRMRATPIGLTDIHLAAAMYALAPEQRTATSIGRKIGLNSSRAAVVLDEAVSLGRARRLQRADGQMFYESTPRGAQRWASALGVVADLADRMLERVPAGPEEEAGQFNLGSTAGSLDQMRVVAFALENRGDLGPGALKEAFGFPDRHIDRIVGRLVEEGWAGRREEGIQLTAVGAQGARRLAISLNALIEPAERRLVEELKQQADEARLPNVLVRRSRRRDSDDRSRVDENSDPMAGRGWVQRPARTSVPIREPGHLKAGRSRRNDGMGRGRL